MLSYRHAFHAGNHADVVKHLVLVNVLEYLLRKDAPVLYIDTHAGAGSYRLDDPQALKTGEAAAGVEYLDLSGLTTEAKTYCDLVDAYLKRRQYPGSPRLAADLLRPCDQLRLFELHSRDEPALRRLFGQDRRVRVECSNGFDSLKALLPVKNRRALVLMDPSYELKTDYAQVAASIQQGYQRMPHGVFLVWYPVVQRKQVDGMISLIERAGVRDFWQFELGLRADSTDYGMTASGMLVINPPWVLSQQMAAVLPELQRQLAPEQGFFRIEQRVAE